MALTNTHARSSNRVPVPARAEAALPLADMAWWMTGSLVVVTVSLAVVIAALIRSMNGEITMAWFISRGTGIAGYLLITGAMIYGLLMTSKTATADVPVPVSYGMHEFISWIGLVFSAAHGVVLMWDGYIHYTPSTILLPFSSSYRPTWVGIGQVAFYLSAILIASFYAKKRLGHRSWRTIHYASFLAFILITLHGIYSGTDTKEVVMQVVYIFSAGVVLYLSLVRILTAVFDPKPRRRA